MNLQFKKTGGADFPDHLKVLLTGDPKTGKTSLLGTVPNILILDTEPHANNLQSVAHLNLPYATINSTQDLEQAKLFLQDPAMRQMMAESLGMEKIEAVAIDTLDTLQAILKRDRMKAQRQTKFLRDDWGWLKEEMTSIISAFTALPLHVFFTVHSKSQVLGDQEKGDSRTIVQPGLEGAIAEKIAGMVGYSLMTFRRQEVLPDGSPKTTYLLRAEGDETYGFLGNRAAGKLPPIIEPTFATIKHYAELARNEAQAVPQVAPLDLGIASPQQPGQQQMPVQAPANPVVQNAVQPQAAPQAAPAPQAQAPQTPRPPDDEPVNAAALTHLKKVYDGIGMPMPEELVMSKTLGEARTVVKLWVAIQDDYTQGKGTAGSPQEEMISTLRGMGWLAEDSQPVQAEAAVQPKIDGTIDQVVAYVGSDIAKAQEAYNLEISKDKPRAGLIEKLVARGAQPKAPEVQTPVENAAPAAPQPEVTQASEQADVPSTEKAIENVQEGLGGEVVAQEDQPNDPCEQCGRPVDDLDIAKLSKARFNRWLCVSDYLVATKSS